MQTRIWKMLLLVVATMILAGNDEGCDGQPESAEQKKIKTEIQSRADGEQEEVKREYNNCVEYNKKAADTLEIHGVEAIKWPKTSIEENREGLYHCLAQKEIYDQTLEKKKITKPKWSGNSKTPQQAAICGRATLQIDYCNVSQETLTNCESNLKKFQNWLKECRGMHSTTGEKKKDAPPVTIVSDDKTLQTPQLTSTQEPARIKGVPFGPHLIAGIVSNLETPMVITPQCNFEGCYYALAPISKKCADGFSKAYNLLIRNPTKDGGEECSWRNITTALPPEIPER